MARGSATRGRLIRAAGLGGLVAVLAACGSGGGGLNVGAPAGHANAGSDTTAVSTHKSSPRNASPTHGTTAHATAPATSGASLLDGQWTGTYQCGQGTTALQLVIAGPDSALFAVFHFQPTGANASAQEGVFTMTGDATIPTFSLTQQAWQQQPPGYQMVDLVGVLSKDHTSLLGTVYGAGCTTFSLKRASS